MTQLIQMRPLHYCQGLRDLVQYVSSNLSLEDRVMVEIGCYTGESTEVFLEQFRVIAIDPFESGYDSADIASSSDYTAVLNLFNKRVGSRIDRLLQMKSDEAINYLDNQVGFVYIDGMHTYDQTLKDIKNYQKVVKSGGFIGGHDYNRDWPGVCKAVNEVYGTPLVVFNDSSWIVKL
jgi:cephalosporin hydroxylase